MRYAGVRSISYACETVTEGLSGVLDVVDSTEIPFAVCAYPFLTRLESTQDSIGVILYARYANTAKYARRRGQIIDGFCGP